MPHERCNFRGQGRRWSHQRSARNRVWYAHTRFPNAAESQIVAKHKRNVQLPGYLFGPKGAD